MNNPLNINNIEKSNHLNDMPHIENVNGEYSVTKSQQKLVYVKKKSTTYGGNQQNHIDEVSIRQKKKTKQK